MSVSETGRSGRGDAGTGASIDLPTEQVPAARPQSTRPRLTVSDPADLDDRPVDVPTIVPATDRRGAPVREQPVEPPADPDDVATEAPADADWDHLTPTPMVVPAPQPTRLASRRPRVRKVTRVVRHLDPWSVFKVSIIFAAVTYVVVLTSGVLLWNVALTTGTVDNVERWFTQFGWETFELDGGELFRGAWTAGLFVAVGLVGVAVLLATIFNLVSDMVGGVRVTVLEEEVIERVGSTGKRLVVSRAPAPTGAGRPVQPGQRV